MLSLQVVVPAAGESKRFREKGISTPKPLIKFQYGDSEVKAMYQHAINGLEDRRVFLGCKPSHQTEFEAIDDATLIIPIPSTFGQADTVKQIVAGLTGKDPVLVINSDNMFLYPLHIFIKQAEAFDAAVLVFDGEGNRAYSYVDGFPLFDCGVEKNPISPWAIAGAFYFDTADILKEALQKHEDNISWFGEEPYLSETLSYITGPKLAVQMPKKQLIGWGTPEELLADPNVTHLEMEVSKYDH